MKDAADSNLFLHIMYVWHIYQYDLSVNSLFVLLALSPVDVVLSVSSDTHQDLCLSAVPQRSHLQGLPFHVWLLFSLPVIDHQKRETL